ncbi:MAG: glycosyltransferase family 9 protein, partial [Lacipirellulaceae bacterium]
MATPAIRALRKLDPQGQFVGIMRPYVGQVLDGLPWFDDRIFWAKKSDKPELQWSQVKALLRAAKLDRIVLLTNSLRTAWMARQSGAPERIGTARDLRGLLLTTRVYEPKRGRSFGNYGRNRQEKLQLPATDGYLQVATAAGCPPEPPTLELATTAADEQAADEAWIKLDLPSPDRVVVFNTGGAFGAAKDWPAEHFTDLARRIAREQDLHVLINCGPSEREVAQAIVDEASDSRVTSLAPISDLPIGLSKAIIRRSRLLVSTDSGPRFFGIAFGVPTVSLFGPTSTLWTRTYSNCETPLSLNLDCAPCMQRTCPLKHHRCMQDLSVDRVHTAVLDSLQKKSQRKVAA